MIERVYSWLGREFVELSGEGRAAGSPAEEAEDLFRRFEEKLRALELSRQNIVRTRLWCSEREARNSASSARSKFLTGAEAASSSYISVPHFDSNAKVAVDLLAMRPSHPAVERKPVDFDPPRAYLRYLRFDSILFFSGYTSNADTFEAQVSQVIDIVDGALGSAGANWSQVVKLSVFLHRSQKLDALKSLLLKANKLEISRVEFGFVDGFAGEKSLLEAEATAAL
jgi:enamine deaminase RidA (YjgF/YER057c/UK114 family)